MKEPFPWLIHAVTYSPTLTTSIMPSALKSASALPQGPAPVLNCVAAAKPVCAFEFTTWATPVERLGAFLEALPGMMIIDGFGSSETGAQGSTVSMAGMEGKQGAFRMDDRKQRVIVHADGGEGIGFFGFEVADAAALKAGGVHNTMNQFA